MSVGARFDADEIEQSTVSELFAALGEHDTPTLFDRPVKLDTSFTIPAGGGSSLDRKTAYIDTSLYSEIMDGAFESTGLNPVQIIDRIIEHEHVEICLEQGDNAVDDYLPAHQRALRKEHEGVLAILGRDDAEKKIKQYEDGLWPGLERCYARPVKNPPKDLWCGVHVSHPTERDEEILEAMARLGVIDAQKRAKYEVRYGFGEHRCVECRMWQPEKLKLERGALAMCSAVSGIVRDVRHCDLWMPKQGFKQSA